MNDNDLGKELDKLDREIKKNNIKIEADKKAFSELLLNGLGEQITTVLKQPKPKKKNNIKEFIKKIFNVI